MHQGLRSLRLKKLLGYVISQYEKDKDEIIKTHNNENTEIA